MGGFNLLNGLRKDVPNLIEYAKNKHMKTGLDPNWDPEGWPENRLKDVYDVLKVVDWFFPDLKEGEAITFTDKDILIIKKLLNLGPKIVCLKMGERGCLVGDRDKIELVKSFDVKPINTTGSGDVFLAAFIKGYLSGDSLKEMVVFANAAGALSTTKIGLERYPTYKEVIEFIETKT
jgi:2-dehydro-3-deoxygluconokinase